MKWITAILMIVNVAIYLSVGSPSVDPVSSNPSDSIDVNLEGMLLLHELSTGEDDLVQREVGATEVTALQDIKEEVEVAVVEAGMLSCHRIGPFRQEDHFDTARKWMVARDISFEEVTTHTRELKAMRVFVGPFRDQSQIKSAIDWLKSNNLDSYPFKGEDGLTRVSLGYFTQKGLADKFLAHLTSLGVGAKTSQEFRRLGPYRWLETNVTTTDEKSLKVASWMKLGGGFEMTGC